ncbi:MAG: ABC transporter substrate-binding protein [Candidatus Methylomirabilia bacterium]
MIALLAVLQASLTIALGGSPTSLEHLPIRVAEAQGDFAREGLAVTILSARTELDAAAALAQGQAELAAISLEAALRFGTTDGKPPRLVFGLTAAPPVALLVPAAYEESVRELTDLSGKRVGVASPGAPEQTLLMALLERAGLEFTRITLLSLGARGLVAALERGEVHAGLVGDPWTHYLVKEGKAKILMDFRLRREAKRWLGGATVHTGLFTRANDSLPAARLARVARALLRAIRRLETVPPGELLARLPPRVLGTQEEERKIRLESARELYLPGGQVRPEAIRRSLAVIRARAPLPHAVLIPRSLTDLLLMDPLDKARELPAER